MKNVAKFLNEVKLELSRVVWPKRDEFLGATIVVIFLVTVMTLYLWQVDFWLSKVVNYVVQVFGA